MLLGATSPGLFSYLEVHWVFDRTIALLGREIGSWCFSVDVASDILLRPLFKRLYTT